MLNDRGTSKRVRGVAVLALVGALLLAAGPASAGATTRAQRAAGTATSAFGLALMNTLPARGNVVFSPDNVATALAMAGTGAAGSTATQLASGLHLASPAGFAPIGDLQRTLLAEQPAAAHGDSLAPELDLAGGLFVQSGYPLKPGFVSGLAQRFGAAPQTVDFTTPAALGAINGWVSDTTHGRIPHILSSLDPRTRLALATAIFLKAQWALPFMANATAPGTFRGEAGATRVPFMHRTVAVPYARAPGYAAVELPYRSSTLSLMVVLPRGQSVGALARSLDAGRLAQIAARLKTRPVAVSLPRFHAALNVTLNDPLRAMGITQPLSDSADLSGITAAERLKIGVVQHAADFTVDELGTTAAAATVVTTVPTSLQVDPDASVAFTADRPFLFFLRDDRTGALLFAGRLANAAASTS